MEARHRSCQTRKDPTKVAVTPLIPYSFAQLDQRSGYPAGVMDPVWQQTMLQRPIQPSPEHSSPIWQSRLPSTNGTRGMSRELRMRSKWYVWHATWAGCVVIQPPGRGELLEAIETALVQGDLFGRGRAVAAAAQTVLVGKQRGRLPGAHRAMG